MDQMCQYAIIKNYLEAFGETATSEKEKERTIVGGVKLLKISL